MKQKQWNDLIPFYVAQTLSPEETQAFEAYLAECGDPCQQEIADWRMIAAAVWTEADDAARNLPPLSQEVYNRLNYRDQPPATRYSANPPRPVYAAQQEVRERSQRINPRRGVPLTLVAGIFVAIFLGGMLVTLSLRTDEQNASTQIASVPTNEGSGAFGASNADENGSTSLIIESPTPSSTIAPPRPTDTPQPPPPTGVPPVVVPPTSPVTSELPQGGGLPENGDSSVAAVAPQLTLTPTPLYWIPPESLPAQRPYNIRPNDPNLPCEVWNIAPQPITVRSTPFDGSPIVGQVLQQIRHRVYTITESGWYEILLPGSDRPINGWVSPNEAILIGNCAAVPQPTPTMQGVPSSTPVTSPDVQPSPTSAVGVGNRLQIAAPFADVYEQPGFSSARIATVDQGAVFQVGGTTSVDGEPWAQITLEDGRSGWVWELAVTRAP